MFNSNKDVYDFVEKTIGLLKIFGYFEWEKKFRNALVISFMPGEILGAIRKCYIDILDTGIPNEIGINNEVIEVIDELDKALKIK